VKRLRLVPISAVAACLVIGAFASGGSYALAARGGGAEVICKASGKHAVSCPKKELHGKRGKRGPQGLPGPVGPAGPAGPAGAAGAGAGSGLSLNFNAYLTPNKAREIPIGNFIVTAASDALGNCVPITLRAEAASHYSVGPAVAFGPLPGNSSVGLTNGSNSNMFTAVSDNGSSTISGIVGSITVGGRCVVSGYVTGV
jgi:collagen type I alpha